MKHHRLIRFTAALGGLFLAGMLHAMPPAPSPIEMFDKDAERSMRKSSMRGAQNAWQKWQRQAARCAMPDRVRNSPISTLTRMAR